MTVTFTQTRSPRAFKDSVLLFVDPQVLFP